LGIIDTLVVGGLTGAGRPGVDSGLVDVDVDGAVELVAGGLDGVVGGASGEPELHPTTRALIAANPAMRTLVVCMGRHANKPPAPAVRVIRHRISADSDSAPAAAGIDHASRDGGSSTPHRA
jgi:hypothetical protein